MSFKSRTSLEYFFIYFFILTGMTIQLMRVFFPSGAGWKRKRYQQDVNLNNLLIRNMLKEE